MTDELQDDNVIEFADFEAGAIVRRKTRDFRTVNRCKHPRVDLIEDRREVECRTCRVKVDPFEWIVELARNTESLKREWVNADRWRAQTSIHAPGIGGDLLRCKAHPGGGWTVSITNKTEGVTCRQCRALIPRDEPPALAVPVGEKP